MLKHLWIVDAIVVCAADTLTKEWTVLLFWQHYAACELLVNHKSVSLTEMCLISSCCCGFQELDHGLFIFAIFNILINFLMVWVFGGEVRAAYYFQGGCWDVHWWRREAACLPHPCWCRTCCWSKTQGSQTPSTSLSWSPSPQPPSLSLMTKSK